VTGDVQGLVGQRDDVTLSERWILR
jgi:hypothetical protein